MLPSQRHHFDIPRGVAYLNSASYAPIPRCVREAGTAGVAAKSTPWTMPGDVLEPLRAAAAGLVCATADDMAVTPSVSYGIATAANNLPVPAGSRILIAEGEYPSQALIWAHRARQCGATLDIVRREPGQTPTEAMLARLDPSLPPIAIAALTPLSWTDGTPTDLEQLTPRLHAMGAAIVVDATQAAGILDIDAAALHADFITFPTYKWLLGPYSLAFLYAAPRHHGGAPLERHSGNHTGTADPRTAPLHPSARRYDMGERANPVALPMALAGLTLLQSWDRTALQARLRPLTDALATAAINEGWQPVSILHPPHILALAPPTGQDIAATIARLAAHHVYAAERNGLLRLGLHAFNDETDIERFTSVLRF